jgi:hypothetical protein
MDGDLGWRSSVERIEEEFERGDADSLAVLFRDARRSRLPPIPDAACRLLVIQGLERAERCAEAGYLALARTEFTRVVARVEEARSSDDDGSRSPAAASEDDSCGDAPLLEVSEC